MSRHKTKIKSILFNKGYNKKEYSEVLEKIYSFKDKEIVAFYNPECIGIMNATKDMFENTVGIKEIFSDKFAVELAEAIIDSNIGQVIFSSIALGWKKVVLTLHEKKPDIKIKFLWHGAHAMLVQLDETYFLYSIIELLDRNIVNSIGFVKESMAEFYKKKGYNAYFLPNTVKNLTIENKEEKKHDGNLIGLYSAGSRWEKNTFNQLSAISLIPNATVDILPVNDLTKSFCKLMNIKIEDDTLGYIPREELLRRMARNDINLYVTFTECSPVIPLESLELGVPCITGNNHHYFRDSKLYDYLVVKSEDDIDEISNKIKLVFNNKEEIIKLYKEWKKKYDIYVDKKLQEFIES